MLQDGKHGKMVRLTNDLRDRARMRRRGPLEGRQRPRASDRGIESPFRCRTAPQLRQIERNERVETCLSCIGLSGKRPRKERCGLMSKGEGF